ncbi:MAG: hypothetical protein L6M37_05330 [Candidatus Methylarchaceae archaeon HK02M1]|nr:hypothetical protein [Candidatus Methylarchaceae archaeon HK01M]MCP8312354.1 hypothetical protein [Candidatus Methylarchaceae archaeon HK02M1]
MSKKGRTIKKPPKLLTEPRDYVVVFFNDEQHYNKFKKGLKESVEFLAEEKQNAFILYQGRWLKCLYAQSKEQDYKELV